ncbi:MAG: exodeoxyribonuclease gamma subunit, partial [Pseudonocardiales bacterium]|nr:exodeoxyribonuclease gamma subunit [Pseudonocardiales bacterium]
VRLGTSPGRSDGVCANLRFPFPGRLVGDALAAATGVDRASDPWRPERLSWPLLDVVDASLGESWLEVLAAHLGGVDTLAGDRDRRFAAVRHLSDLFDRYAVHRPAMLRAWVAGSDEDGDGVPLPVDMAWQAKLWRQLRRVIAAPSPPERLLDGCAALAADPTLADLPDRITLFGLTRLPASYLDVLHALAAHRDVHVLALQPSPTAWATIAALPTRDRDSAAEATRHPLLRAWGRDSREMQLVLAARLSGHEATVDRHHPLPGFRPGTLLQRLQSAIRADTPPLSGEPQRRPPLATDDRSVQVHACHGRARQAEVVRDAITHMLADDPTLEPRDIVVLCPDIDELAPLLHSAFAATPADGAVGELGQPAIPYRLADRSLRQTNPVLGALSEVLSLVDSRLTASQVLALAALTPVRERFGLDDDDLDRLSGWIEATGIRWGLDAAHRGPYDLAAVDTGTWDVGLIRLLLGVTMSEDDERLVGGALPLDDVDSGDIDLVGRFTELLRRVRDAVTDLVTQRPIGGWVDALNRAADLLLATRPDDDWQRSQLDQLLADVLSEAGTAGERLPLRLAEVRDLLADRLRGQPTRAAFRTGELTMCTLVPMRSVPHRVICIVGLDDGAFPRGGSPDGDDILVRARHVGDHDRRAEDRQLLLDAVLAAGDALVITYSGADIRTNEELPPAVPVNELLDVIDATVATADGSPARAQVVRHHPLRPSDPRCFIPGHLGTPGPWGFDPMMLAGAHAASGPAVAPGPFLPTPLPPYGEQIVALNDLVTFVTHPVRAFLRQRLGLSLRTDDDRPIDALAVELDSLAAWGVGNRLLSSLLAGADIDQLCAAELARGLLPPGALGRTALDAARVRAKSISDEAAAVADGPRSSLEVDIALPGGRRLVGTVADVVGDVVRATTFSRLKARERLVGWVRLLAVSAAHPQRCLSSATVGWGRNGPTTIGINPLGETPQSRSQRAAELLAVVVDLRDRGMREPLPPYCATSHRYATAVRSGHDFPDADADKFWTSEYKWNKEDKDPEHVLVLGGVVPFAEVLAAPPAADENGPGWENSETTRFGRLARRLWDPILDTGRTV